MKQSIILGICLLVLVAVSLPAQTAQQPTPEQQLQQMTVQYNQAAKDAYEWRKIALNLQTDLSNIQRNINSLQKDLEKVESLKDLQAVMAKYKLGEVAILKKDDKKE